MSKKIKLKHKYRTRNGLKVKLFAINDKKHNKLYPVIGMIQHKDQRMETNVWAINGLNQSNVTDGEYDLIRVKKKKSKKVDEPKKIDLKKTYVTREGLTVKLCFVDENQYFPLHGYIKEDDQWCNTKWTLHGSFWRVSESKYDLILASEYDKFENRKC